MAKAKNPNTLHYFDGAVMWAKVHHPDPEYNNFSVDFYPDDLDAVAAVMATEGSKLTQKEAASEDAPGPLFYKFRREESRVINDRLIKFGPPLVVDVDGETEFTKLIGNGSKVTCKVEFFDTRNGRGHRLLAVKINELVPYDPEEPKEVKHLPF